MAISPFSSRYPVINPKFPRVRLGLGLPALARATALFFGLFSLLNTAGSLAHPGFDATLWWLDLRFLPADIYPYFTGTIALLLCVWALMPAWRLWGLATDVGLLTCVVVAIVDALGFYAGARNADFIPATRLPLSLIVAAAMAFVFLMRRRVPDASLVPVLLFAGVWAVCFPVLQMYLFGTTNYERRAQVAVVFGARVYSDGTLSQALFDRTRTGVSLYQKGRVSKLIFSGGPGDGNTHETASMERYAVLNGVPRKDVIRDMGGVNTHATVLNSHRIFRKEGLRRVLVVSHFYHLPRIKLTYARHGIDVWTVPALETYTLHKMPYLVLREVAALWLYYLRPVAELGIAGRT